MSLSLGAKAGQIVVDTGPGPSNSFYDLNANQDLAGEIQLATATDVIEVDGWMAGIKSGQPDNGGLLTIDITSGTPGGTVLGGGSTQLAAGIAPGWYGISNLNVNLAAGTYWIDFSSPAVMQSPVAAPLAHYEIANQSTWKPDPALSVGVRVIGASGVPAPVPDSASTALMLAGALGGLGLAAFHARRRSA